MPGSFPKYAPRRQWPPNTEEGAPTQPVRFSTAILCNYVPGAGNRRHPPPKKFGNTVFYPTSGAARLSEDGISLMTPNPAQDHAYSNMEASRWFGAILRYVP